MSFLTAKGRYGYARGHRLLEVACIIGMFVQMSWLSWRVYLATTTWYQALGVATAFVVGFFLTDVVSGIVHWAGDTVGSESSPVVGPNFIKPFRDHHGDPKDITRHDFIETNGNNCIASVVILAPIMAFMPAHPGIYLFFTTLMLSLMLFIFGTNQFHKWAHADDNGAVVRWLQRCGLILGVDHHKVHHTAPYDTYYCITHGLMNPFLARVGFFRFLERVVARVRPGILYLDERTKLAAQRAAAAGSR